MSLDDVEVRLVDSIDEAFALKRWLGERGRGADAEAYGRPSLGLDSETEGFSPIKDKLRLVQIGDDKMGWAIPWERWGGVAEEIITQWEGNWILHNSPFDEAFLARAGVKLDRSRVLDTMPMAHILDPLYSVALKNLAAKHVDPRAKVMQDELDDAIGSKGGWTWATVPISFQKYWAYGALDPVLTYRLFQNQWQRLKDDGSMAAYELEVQVQWLTREMSMRGAHVDRAYAAKKRDEFVAYCVQVAQWCQDSYNVAPGSNLAVIQVLQEHGVEFSKRTKGGAVSLDVEVLEQIDHPLAQAVLGRRRIQKIASTYLDHIVEEADSDDLMHPDIRPLGTRTSRMSMANPNLQNLPRASETNTAANTVRNCYTTRYGDDGTMVFCDFDQIEMRGLAHMSQDEGLRNAFLSPDDFFIVLARSVFNDPTISSKKDPRRQVVKNVGYGKIYGAGVPKLAKTAGISEEQASAAMRAFDSSFPGVRAFQNRVQRTALDRKRDEGVGYVRSPLTQRRHPSDDGKEYALVNYLVQGLAAEMFKIKIIELSNAGLGQFMVLPVHDEVILDVPNDNLPDVINILKGVMNDDKLLSIPVTAGLAVGQRWGSKTDVA